MHIGIIGPGRLGRSLARLFEKKKCVVSLTGRELRLPTVDVRILTVPDRAIRKVAVALPIGTPTLHCSGALGLAELEPHTPIGTLHPLMTFPGPELGMPEERPVPAAISGDAAGIVYARKLAHLLDMVPFDVPNDRRLYHAAAVLSGNFSAVLLAEAAAILSDAGIPKDQAMSLLAPLTIQSIRNATADASLALTGPAVRGDRATSESHCAALREVGRSETSRLYELLAQQAIKLSKVKPAE